MKVACIQSSCGENYNKNFKQIIFLVNKAVKNRADLIITPETSSLITNDKKILYKNSYKMLDDPLIKKIREISKKNKKWILIGSLPIKDKSKYRNRSIMINPKGEIAVYYDKINMFNVRLPNKEKHNESSTYKSGNKLVSVKLPWGNLGLTICYDLRFPEIYRNLSKKKLSFISVPSAFTKITGQKHWLTLLKARAIENFCYIFAPAQGGTHYNGRKTFGHSMVVSPDGKILKELKKSQGVITVSIDPALPKKLRSIIPSLKSD